MEFYLTVAGGIIAGVFLALAFLTWKGTAQKKRAHIMMFENSSKGNMLEASYILSGNSLKLTAMAIEALMNNNVFKNALRYVPRRKYEKYNHHGQEVTVSSALKGMHRDFCLCYGCDQFQPETLSKCPKADRLYKLCVEEGMTTPVFECPEFVEKAK